MVDSAPRGLGDRRRTGMKNARVLRPLALIMVVVGIMGWPGTGSFRAQERDQRPGTNQPPPPPPTAPTVPGGQPFAPPVLEASQPQPAPSMVGSLLPRFHFKIAADTPLKDILPFPPKVKQAARPLITEDLAKVPEVEFQTPLTKDLPRDEALKQTAFTIAKINHLNDKKTEAFMEALVRERSDLAGLPFAMGDACRTKGERSKQFALAVGTVRRSLQPQSFAVTNMININTQPSVSTPAQALGIPVNAAFTPQQLVTRFVASAVGPERNPAETFWEQYQTNIAQEDKLVAQVDRGCREHTTLARIAALMQVLAPESPSMRLGLVKHLATISHVGATQAIARLAIFSAEDEVRQAAVDALKVRRERDYTDILVGGLRYPWPSVARRAAEAIVKLERTDLVPLLVDLLDETDPRAPTIKEINKKKVPVAQELARINHHRNCMLCHAPGNTGNVSQDTLTAGVPIPNEPLPSPFDGYRTSSPDILVRLDVTYLRQDFSVFQAVDDAHPWPEMQRFDFLVRARVLSEQEAEAYREKFAGHEPGRLSPYHRAALAALRELTGRDTEPRADAWRKLLGLPAQPVRKEAMATKV